MLLGVMNFKIQILLCQTITFVVFAEVAMCKILKMVFWKGLFQKGLFWCLMFVSRIKQNKHFVISVESNVTHVPNARLFKRWINDYTSVKLTVVQASIRRLENRLFNNWTAVNSTVVQVSNQQLDNRRIDGYNCRIDDYIEYLLKRLKFLDIPSVPRYSIKIYNSRVTKLTYKIQLCIMTS